jgi:DNA-directed RNA polymerase specialized sigma24 family protein
MSQPSPEISPTDPSSGEPAALSHQTRDGRRYVRRAEVRDEIHRAIGADPAAWDVPRFQSETIVHLLRQFRTCAGTMSAYTKLVEQLGRMIARIVADYSKGIDASSREELIDQVQNDVIALILAPSRSRKGEFLEVSFRRVVKGLVLNAVDAHFDRLRALPTVQLVADRDDGYLDGRDPGAAVADDGPLPDEIVIREEVRRLVRSSLDAITDPRHREAVILRFEFGWPITDKDPTTPTLCGHFKRKERQIRNWLQTALDQMRESIGEKP